MRLGSSKQLFRIFIFWIQHKCGRLVEAQKQTRGWSSRTGGPIWVHSLLQNHHRYRCPFFIPYRYAIFAKLHNCKPKGGEKIAQKNRNISISYWPMPSHIGHCKHGICTNYLLPDHLGPFWARLSAQIWKKVRTNKLSLDHLVSFVCSLWSYFGFIIIIN